MNLLRKVVAGGPGRPTRMHTERGEMITPQEMSRLPVALAQMLSSRMGLRPILPWWPLNVIPVIERHLTPESRVVEFGSGYSTIWLAERAAQVLAIEHDAGWAAHVQSMARDREMTNATVEWREAPDYYTLEKPPMAGFDLAIVDGSWRWKCVEAVLPLMAPGGVVYLDNSDADKDLKSYDMPGASRLAQAQLEAFARGQSGAQLKRYASLLMGELHAGEGMLLKMPNA